MRRRKTAKKLAAIDDLTELCKEIENGEDFDETYANEILNAAVKSGITFERFCEIVQLNPEDFRDES